MYTMAPSVPCDSRYSVPENVILSPSVALLGIGSNVIEPVYFRTVMVWFMVLA